MPEPRPVIRVLVADDHPVVRKGLVSILNADPRVTVVAEAENGAEAVRQFEVHRPDVVMVDLRMPILGGVETIAAIRALAPDAKVIIVTAVDGEEDIYRGLRAGARAFVLKDAPDDEIVHAVLATMEGRRYLAPAVAAKLADHVNSAQLSDRELDILRLMATGLSNKRIALRAAITEGTVKFHVNNILSKLQCASRTEAVAAALRRGLIDLGD